MTNETPNHESDDDDRQRPPQDRVPEGERLARRKRRKSEDHRARNERLGLGGIR